MGLCLSCEASRLLVCEPELRLSLLKFGVRIRPAEVSHERGIDSFSCALYSPVPNTPLLLIEVIIKLIRIILHTFIFKVCI